MSRKVNTRTPVSAGNICVQKWDYNYHQSKHRQKIRSMKPTIDTAPPKSCFLRHLQMGRDQNARQQATAKASQDDLKMIKVIAETMTRPLIMPDANKGHFSLNRDYRNREIRRIVNENQFFYRRLLKAKGQLSYDKLMQDHNLQQEHMINSSHTLRYALRNNTNLDCPLSFRSNHSSPCQVGQDTIAEKATEEHAANVF